MNAWWVGDRACGYVLVRADTRNRARRYFPCSNDYIDTRAARAPQFDGPGPERELEAIYEPCPHGRRESDGVCLDCDEFGLVVDVAATVAANAEETR